MHHDCCTSNHSLVALDASDELIFKVARISRVAQIARIETKLRRYLLLKWEQRSLQAIKSATTMFRNGATAAQISTHVSRVMNRWKDDVIRRVFRDIENVYRTARDIGADKAGGEIKGSLQYDTNNFSSELGIDVKKATVPFSLVDEQAVTSIQEEHLFWIGEHYDKHVSNEIREVTRATVIEAGTNRKKAAQLLQERVKKSLTKVSVPDGYTGSSASYFEGLVSNAVTNARAMGQLRSFSDLGVERYQIVNPSDSRTCPVCSHLDGKVFTVDQGTAQMSRDLAAKKPEEIKKIHPWFSAKKIRAISPKSGKLSGKAGTEDSKRLAAAGVSMPPFHFRCRCTVDIDPSSPISLPVAEETQGWPAELDKKKLAAALSKIKKTGVTKSAVARGGSRSILDRYGMKYRRPKSEQNVLMIQDTIGSSDHPLAGAMNEEGWMRLTTTTRDGAVQFLNGSRDKTHVANFKTFLHEEIHAHTPAKDILGISPSGKAFYPAATAVEEATTEFAARSIVSDIVGGTDVMTQSRSYDKEIGNVLELFQKRLKLSPKDAQNVLRKVSFAMRDSTQSRIITDADEFVEYFVKRVARPEKMSPNEFARAQRAMINDIKGGFLEKAPKQPHVSTRPVTEPGSRRASAESWNKSLSPSEKKAVTNWTESEADWQAMRLVDSGRATQGWLDKNPDVAKKLRKLREATAKAPEYSGKAFRVMSLSKDQSRNFTGINNVVTQDSLANWSKELKVAQDAAAASKNDVFVIIEMNVTKGGAADLGQDVLVEKGVRFRIKKTAKIDVGGKTGYHVVVEQAKMARM